MSDLGVLGSSSWVPVKSAARILGISKQRVYVLAQKGDLARQEIDGTVLISLRSIQLLEDKRRRGIGGRNADR